MWTKDQDTDKTLKIWAVWFIIKLDFVRMINSWEKKTFAKWLNVKLFSNFGHRRALERILRYNQMTKSRVHDVLSLIMWREVLWLLSNRQYQLVILDKPRGVHLICHQKEEECLSSPIWLSGFKISRSILILKSF